MRINKKWSVKKFLAMPVPSEEDFRPDTERILEQLKTCPEFEKEEILFPAHMLKKLYPLCWDAGWEITVTLGYDGRNWQVTEIEPEDTTSVHYGLCMDLGSTTMVMELVDLVKKKVIARESIFNPQTLYGEDILTRIFYTKDDPKHLEEIQNATISGLVQLIEKLEEKTGIRKEQYSTLILAGNTTMIHFLLGLDAFCVFQSPYAVRTLAPGITWARELGLPIPGFLYCYPARANYLGGDIISGAVGVGMLEEEEICVFLDIGTNGELVVGNRDFLIAGAGAAGPALEGGTVMTGMKAQPGAVDRVVIENGEIKVHTIADEQAKGICGSGIVDLLAQLFLNGWMDFRGKLVEGACPQMTRYQEEPAVEYAPGLLMRQTDIDEFIKTKAAAMTMVEYMLNLLGVSVDQVKKFYIAGAFGTYIDKESAVTIGLYPDLERDRLCSPGNASLLGARKLLLDRSRMEDAKKVLDYMEYVQFGAVDDFLHRMVAASAIPHTDFQRFPSVMKALEDRRSAR